MTNSAHMVCNTLLIPSQTQLMRKQRIRPPKYGSAGCVCDCVYDCVEDIVVQAAPVDVFWHCSKCTAHSKECARPSQQLDALSSTGRKHRNIYEKDLFASHQRLQFHLDSLTHESPKEKEKAEEKIKTHVKLTEVLTPEDELQNDHMLRGSRAAKSCCTCSNKSCKKLQVKTMYF